MIPDTKTFQDYSHIGHVESWLNAIDPHSPLPAWAYAGPLGGMWRFRYCGMYKEAA